MSLNEEGQGDTLLRAKLDVAIEQSLKKKADSMEQIVWRGSPVPVKNDKVRVCVLEARELGKKAMDTTAEQSKRFTHFDKLFMVLNDALSHIRNDVIAVSQQSCLLLELPIHPSLSS